MENVGQGDEYQRRTRIGIDAYGEGCGEYHESGEYRHKHVYQRYLASRLREVGAALEVRSVCTQARRAQRQREECLTQCVEEYVVVHLREVGVEQKVNSAPRSRQHARGNDDDDE